LTGQETAMARTATSPRPTLDDTQLATLRAALEECRAERAAQLDVVQDGSATGDPVAVAHAASVKRVFDSVVAALGRMDAGTYGACAWCDKPIPYARLEVLPYTTGCVHCLNRRDEAW
jgi:DnaK suppressor protein